MKKREERVYYWKKNEKKRVANTNLHRRSISSCSLLSLSKTMNADALAAAKAAVRPLSLKELRLQLRARGLTPAGGLDTLRARLEEHMAETGDW